MLTTWRHRLTQCTQNSWNFLGYWRAYDLATYFVQSMRIFAPSAIALQFDFHFNIFKSLRRRLPLHTRTHLKNQSPNPMPLIQIKNSFDIFLNVSMFACYWCVLINREKKKLILNPLNWMCFIFRIPHMIQDDNLKQLRACKKRMNRFIEYNRL